MPRSKEAANHIMETGRRQAVLGALGLAAGLSAERRVSAATPAARTLEAPANPRRIDVHHHYVPPRYRAALEAAGQSRPSGMPGIPKWSVEESLAMMDRIGIESAVLSVVNGVHFGDDAAARDLSRHVNEEGARAVSDHPRRLGLFATVPLPDLDGALEEIARAFDDLHVDGVVLSSNYRGAYLGDPRFEPVFAQLNQRKATVFIHPFDPFCACGACGQAPGVLQAPGYPYPMIEFMFETARTVFNLVLSGTLDKYPDIKFIVPHAGAGGVLPVLAERVDAVSSLLKLGKSQETAHVRGALRKLYYDLAGWPEPVGMAALLEIADPSRLLYGSDWPYTPEFLGAGLARTLDQTTTLTAAMRKAFMRENALALIPRFAES